MKAVLHKLRVICASFICFTAPIQRKVEKKKKHKIISDSSTKQNEIYTKYKHEMKKMNRHKNTKKNLLF